MRPIPKKINDRLSLGIKKFKPILADARSRDINESDTVVIVTDVLSEFFGFAKYSEITSEFSIRGTYCDLATRIDGDLQYLIEVKAIGLELKDSFIKQAIDYAANEGIDWVILTNGNHWIVFRVSFSKPIDKDQVMEFNFLDLNSKNKMHLEMLFSLSREGCNKSILDEYHSRRQVLSKYFIGSIIMTDSILNSIRKELRKIEPEVKIEIEQLRDLITQDVIKRDILDSEKSKDATKKINRVLNRERKKKEKDKEQKLNAKLEDFTYSSSG